MSASNSTAEAEAAGSPGVAAAALGDDATQGAATGNVTLPVLDLSLLSTEAGSAALAETLGNALEQTGFFLLENHGVPKELIDGVYGLAAKLHALPLEEKMKVVMNEHKTGYVPFDESQGLMEDRVPSANESFFVRFRSFVVNSEGVEEQAVNQWPSEAPPPAEGAKGVPGFQKLILAYVAEMDTLAHRLLPLMAQALHLPANYFDQAFQDTAHSLRLLHYPPAPVERIGVGGHTDTGILTLLAQSDKPGLELCLPDGRWVRPQALPGAILVNSGDLLRRWTNHKWLSTLHRVVNPAGQERYAIPFFWNPNGHFVLETLPGCSDEEENPPRYKPITQTEFMAGWYAGNYKALRAEKPSLTSGQDSAVSAEGRLGTNGQDAAVAEEQQQGGTSSKL